MFLGIFCHCFPVIGGNKVLIFHILSPLTFGPEVPAHIFRERTRLVGCRDERRFARNDHHLRVRSNSLGRDEAFEPENQENEYNARTGGRNQSASRLPGEGSEVGRIWRRIIDRSISSQRWAATHHTSFTSQYAAQRQDLVPLCASDHNT